MASILRAGQTLVGRTGMSYKLQKLLCQRSTPARKERVDRIWLASSNNNSYVAKLVNTSDYNQAFTLQKDLASSPFVRVPVDGNDANLALIFPHYTQDFLNFMQTAPVSKPQVKRILFDVLKGIAACHSNDWVHTDIKPDNIMISYTSDADGTLEINKVALADTEHALKLPPGHTVSLPMGHHFWCSPEANISTGVGRASDMWSFGVTAAYGITKLVIFNVVHWGHPRPDEEIPPEIVVLELMLSLFGPLPSGLREHIKINPAKWVPIWVNDALFMKNDVGEYIPREPLPLWKDQEDVEQDDRDFVGRILNLDPKLRPSAQELLKDEWFLSP